MTPNTPPEATAAELLELAEKGPDQVLRGNVNTAIRMRTAIRELAAIKAQQHGNYGPRPAAITTPAMALQRELYPGIDCACRAQQPSGAQAGLAEALPRQSTVTKNMTATTSRCPRVGKCRQKAKVRHSESATPKLANVLIFKATTTSGMTTLN